MFPLNTQKSEFNKEIFMSILISFIVPTRNRQDCVSSLFNTFEYFVKNICQNFEVIVMNNSDFDDISKEIDHVNFNIKYFYSDKLLSVVENFNSGLRHSTGKYICFIGDDDLISERIFELVEILESHSIDAAIVSRAAKSIYFWPGVMDTRWGDVGGNLYFDDYSGEIKFLGSAQSVRAAELHLGDGPRDLPRAYSGIVSRRAIDLVIERHGELFGGTSPDIYSSRLLADVIERYISIDLPILVAGASKKSTSAARSERTDVGGLRENDHLGRFQSLKWEPAIPEFYAPFTVWAQSYLEASHSLGGRVGRWAFAYLYAKCFLFTRGNSAHIWKSMRRDQNFVMTSAFVCVQTILVLLEYVVQKIPLIINRRPGGTRYVRSGLNDSAAANRALDEALSDIVIHFDDR